MITRFVPTVLICPCRTIPTTDSSLVSMMVELDGKVENGTHGKKRLYPSSLKKEFMQTAINFRIED